MRRFGFQRRAGVALALSISVLAHAALVGWFATRGTAPDFAGARSQVANVPPPIRVRLAHAMSRPQVPVVEAGPAPAPVPSVVPEDLHLPTKALALISPVAHLVAPLDEPQPAASTTPKDTVAAPLEFLSVVPPQRAEVDSPHAVRMANVEGMEGYDVPPIPRDGWVIDSGALTMLPPGGPVAVALIEVSVLSDGSVADWQLLQTNADRSAMLALLRGLADTVMVPAKRGGQPIDARFTVELAFSE